MQPVHTGQVSFLERQPRRRAERKPSPRGTASPCPAQAGGTGPRSPQAAPRGSPARSAHCGPHRRGACELGLSTSRRLSTQTHHCHRAQRQASQWPPDPTRSLAPPPPTHTRVKTQRRKAILVIRAEPEVRPSLPDTFTPPDPPHPVPWVLLTGHPSLPPPHLCAGHRGATNTPHPGGST